LERQLSFGVLGIMGEDGRLQGREFIARALATAGKRLFSRLGQASFMPRSPRGAAEFRAQSLKPLWSSWLRESEAGGASWRFPLPNGGVETAKSPARESWLSRRWTKNNSEEGKKILGLRMGVLPWHDTPTLKRLLHTKWKYVVNALFSWWESEIFRLSVGWVLVRVILSWGGRFS